MRCLRIGRRTLIRAVGSSGNRIHIRISGSPYSFENKLELNGGDSEYVPINLLLAGSLISSIVEVVVFNRSGEILHTDTSLPRLLAPYQQIRIDVDWPFKVEAVLAPAGFWHNFFRSFSSFRFGNKTVNRRRPDWPVEVESQAAHNVCRHHHQKLDDNSSVSDDHCFELSPSERMSNASSVLDSPIDQDDKSSVSDDHCIDVISDDSYYAGNTSPETSSFRSCSSPTDDMTPIEENVCELVAGSLPVVGSILDLSKRFLRVITI